MCKLKSNKRCLFALLASSVLLSFSQNKTQTLANHINKIGDCNTPNLITLKNSATYKSVTSPKGYGYIQEINSKISNGVEEEHNSAWHLITIESDGELTFNIIPIDSANDYDFALYQYIDSNFCSQLIIGKTKPIRSNTSNIKKSKLGITGITISAIQTQVYKGLGNPFCKSISVAKGDKYMLLIDNVTPNGRGYSIELDILKKVRIIGRVIDSENKPLVAEIDLFDNKGVKVEKTKSQKDGNYEFSPFLKEKQNYFLITTSDSTFIETQKINTNYIIQNNEYPNIKTVLKKLKKGSKYKLENIIFYGDQDVLLPSSIPSVNALSLLMKKNKKMAIQIEGHTNGEDWHLAIEYRSKEEKILSEKRAQCVYNYLIKNGIESNRMSIIGFGSSIPINREPKNEVESSENRRVEIKIISY